MSPTSASRERERLLASLTDEPRWVETRGALLAGECEIFGEARACVVRADGQRLLSVVGCPEVAQLRAASAGLEGEWALICSVDDASRWLRAFPGWSHEVAILHTLPAGVDRVEAPEVAARIVEVSDARALPTGHLPEPLRREIETVVGSRPLFAAWVDELPVSFCYAAFSTESLWDVSVDTLGAYRRRGLAAACCARAIESLSRIGLRPVWGAVESNIGSLEVARRLGFVAVDRLAVLESDF